MKYVWMYWGVCEVGIEEPHDLECTILGEEGGLGEVVSWVILVRLNHTYNIVMSSIGKQDNKESHRWFSQMNLVDLIII